jgi:hypothetical protein
MEIAQFMPQGAMSFAFIRSSAKNLFIAS